MLQVIGLLIAMYLITTPLGILAIVSIIGLLIYFGLAGSKEINNYYDGEKFKNLERELENQKNTYNSLYKYLDDMRYTFIDKDMIKINDGKLQEVAHVHYCSSTICKNVTNDPYGYIVKYFDIKLSEESIAYFENMLDVYETVRSCKLSLKKDLDIIKNKIKDTDLPSSLSVNEVLNKLGFVEFSYTDVIIPSYKFKVENGSSRSISEYEIVMTIENMNGMIQYIGDTIEYRKSEKYQRVLMTSTFRENIKERDNYTCQICGLSIYDEPNLLLEIDHIVPVSKGGLSVEQNLQTLCWKCNRKKGNRL